VLLASSSRAEEKKAALEEEEGGGRVRMTMTLMEGKGPAASRSE